MLKHEAPLRWREPGECVESSGAILDVPSESVGVRPVIREAIRWADVHLAEWANNADEILDASLAWRARDYQRGHPVRGNVVKYRPRSREEERVIELLIHNPNLTIDDIARTLGNEHLGAPKDVISLVRMVFREGRVAPEVLARYRPEPVRPRPVMTMVPRPSAPPAPTPPPPVPSAPVASPIRAVCSLCGESGHWTPSCPKPKPTVDEMVAKLVAMRRETATQPPPPRPPEPKAPTPPPPVEAAPDPAVDAALKALALEARRIARKHGLTEISITIAGNKARWTYSDEVQS